MPDLDEYPPEYLEEVDAILNGLIQQGAVQPQTFDETIDATRARAAGRGFGVLQGGGKTFTAINPPGTIEREQARAAAEMDNRVLDSLRKQINATKFRTAQQALDAATQFQATRAAQNDRARGVPEVEILRKWGPLMLGRQVGALPGLVNQARPGMAPSVSDIDGLTVLEFGPEGRRQARAVRRPLPKPPLPGQVEGVPVFFDGKQVPNVFGTPNASGTGFNLTRVGPDEAKTTPALELSILNKEIEDLESDLKKLDPMSVTPTPQITQQRTALEQQLKEKRAERGAMRKPKAKETAAPKEASAKEVIRFTKDGRRAVFNADTKEFIRYAD